MNEIKEITVGEVKDLLSAGKSVKVLTKGNKFTKITKFIEKGNLNTFKVILENGNFIKVSKDHRFFTNLGWLAVKDIIPLQTKIYCEDNQYYQIKSIDFVGKERIVDVTVEDKNHCYFGNGMLNHNTGKSLLSAHICAATQRVKGKAIVIDTESSAAPEFWKSLGVDLSKLLYIQRETVEDVFETIEQTIAYIRKNNKEDLVTIIVDSVAGVSTRAELESDHGKDGYATGKAIIISKAMRKITNMIAKQKVLIVFTNQLRQNLNAMAFADKWCVDPFSTKIKIRYKYIEEEITIAEFVERFLGICDFSSVGEIDIKDLNIKILGKNLKTGKDCYNRINTFIVKPEVSEYYTDGKLKGTELHTIIEEDKEIHLKDHPEFTKINEPMKVVDFEIQNVKNYYANGRLNHNTTPGGKALAYHCSVRVRLKNAGKLKKADQSVIGNKCAAVVIKNRMGPPYREAHFDIYYDSGIADYVSWIDVLKINSIITGNAAKWKYTNNAGEVVEFATREFPSLMNANSALKDELYLKICDAVIMKYKEPNSKIEEDAVVDAEEDEKEDANAGEE